MHDFGKQGSIQGPTTSLDAQNLMIHPYIAKLWTQAWAMVMADMSATEISSLFRARHHSTRVIAQRASMIVSRVRLIAGLFAILTPLWIAVDILAFEPAIWRGLLPIRLLTAIAFAAILLIVKNMHTLRDAYRAMLFLFTVPAAFFVSSYIFLSHLDIDGIPDGFATGYAYVPLILLAGLAVFPLTALENVAFAVIAFLAQGMALAPGAHTIEWPSLLAVLGVLALITGISMFAGVSQLAFLIIKVRESIHDSLTGCFSRRCGEELLELQFTWAKRSNTTLAAALVDLDNFKDVNVAFGYAAGDELLKKVTETMYDSMRAGDMLIRWTGDRFLILMPNATLDQAVGAVGRLLSSGLGIRPDNKAITASIGLCERNQDVAEDWWSLVDTAETRARAARESGGNRSVAG
jgi:diguanylate cyclase (GGDEF)-like protein